WTIAASVAEGPATVQVPVDAKDLLRAERIGIARDRSRKSPLAAFRRSLGDVLRFHPDPPPVGSPAADVLPISNHLGGGRLSRRRTSRLLRSASSRPTAGANKKRE